MAHGAAPPRVVELDVLGLRVTMRSSSAAVHEAWAGLFEPFVMPAGSGVSSLDLEIEPGDAGWQLRVDGAVVLVRPDWPALQPVVVTEINRRAVEQMPWFGVHAGVVAAGSSAVAFPGQSGHGKSTAVAACAAAGLTYVSDEALVLAPDGRVVPYPRPIGLSPEMASRLGMKGFGGADEIGVVMAGRPVLRPGVPAQLAHVVLLQREAGAAVRLAELPRADVVVHLLGNSFNHYRDPAAAVRLTAAVAREARCWELMHDAPEDVPRAIRDLLV